MADWYTLNAAVAAYNAGARAAGYAEINVGEPLDSRIKRGTNEDADEAMDSIISAARNLAKWSAALTEWASDHCNARAWSSEGEAAYSIREYLAQLRRVADIAEGL